MTRNDYRRVKLKLSGNVILMAIFIGIIIGALFGGLLPQYTIGIKFIGDMFLRALMMMVVPLVIKDGLFTMLPKQMLLLELNLVNNIIEVFPF